MELCLVDKHYDIPLNIPIPSAKNVNEIASKIISENRLPFYCKKEILNRIEEFISVETEKYYNNLVAPESSNHEFELATKWSNLFIEECSAYTVSDESEFKESKYFPEMYHSLIHSPALETMLNLEHTYALCVEDLVKKRDSTIAQQQKQQSQEMEEAVAKVSLTLTDKDINDLASNQFEHSQKVNDEWETKIGNLKKLQKQEFSEWVTKVYEDYRNGSLKLKECSSVDYAQSNEDQWLPQQEKLEESFTIHLGSQLKVMHNLRLLSANVLELCAHKGNKQGTSMALQPQRLQMSMSLYSNSLSGLVLLVDNRINSYSGIKREFARVCQRSTELHFPDLEEQMTIIRNKASLSSRASKNPPLLKTGDFYVTRHSNLSEVHIVFHLVVDDTLLSSDINSRHPVILGLRQMLRVAHEWDVCAISIPLLLAHDMAEEMTITWCLKRAELVFKCIKGFMIEMASMTGEETRTVQFLVPKGVSDEFFSSLLTMLPGIFRVSNPLVL